jgi:hypothetical protein
MIESPIMRMRGPSAASPTVDVRRGTASPFGNVLADPPRPIGIRPSGGSEPTPAMVAGTSAAVVTGDEDDEPQATSDVAVTTRAAVRTRNDRVLHRIT